MRSPAGPVTQSTLAGRCRRRPACRVRRDASETACKPSSVPRSKRGDGHPSRVPVTRHLMRPTRGRGDAPLPRPKPRTPSYLALHRVELARFTPARRPGRLPARLCGAGPHLAVDGCYPLPRVAVLGLSSCAGPEPCARDHPAISLARSILAPAPHDASRRRRDAGSAPGSRPPGAPPRPGRRARGWPGRRRRGSWHAARGGALQAPKPASSSRAPPRGGRAARASFTRQRPCSCSTMSIESRRRSTDSRPEALRLLRAPAAAPCTRRRCSSGRPSGRATTASGGASGSVGAGRVSVDEDRTGRRRARGCRARRRRSG